MINLKEYTDFIFEAMTPVLKNMLFEKIKVYEDKSFIKKEIKENGILKGLLVYKIENGVCDLFEGYNFSTDKFFLYRYFVPLLKNKDIKLIRAVVQNGNHKILKFYLNLGFKIENKEFGNNYLEFRRN